MHIVVIMRFTLSIKICCFVTIASFSSSGLTQYNLPKKKVLIANKVSAIHVTKTAVKVIKGSSDQFKEYSLDKTPSRIKTYFVNASGRMDSVHQYYRNSNSFDRYLFRFNSTNEIVEKLALNPEGETLARTLLNKNENNEIQINTWQHGVHVYQTDVSADNIITKTLVYNSFRPTLSSVLTQYDLENEEKIESFYEDSILIRREKYKWMTQVNGQVSFKYSKVVFDSETGEVKQKEGVAYSVDKDGAVLSRDKGLFTDPFNSFNYYNWTHKYKGIEHPYTGLMREGELLLSKNDEELIGFDGTAILYEYTFDYSFR